MHRRSFLREKAGCPSIHFCIAEPLRLIVSWVHRSPAFLSFPQCFTVFAKQNPGRFDREVKLAEMKPLFSSPLHPHHAPNIEGSGQSEQQTGEQDGWAGEFDLGMLPM